MHPIACAIPEEIAQHLLPEDMYRLAHGDLKAYQPVVTEVFRTMEFTRNLPEVDSNERNNQNLRDIYRENSLAATGEAPPGRAGQVSEKGARSQSAPRMFRRCRAIYRLPIAEAGCNEPSDELTSSRPKPSASPLRAKNLFLTFFYSRLYQALSQMGDVDLNDKATQQDVTEVSRILRHALQACKDDPYFLRPVPRDIPRHDLPMVVKCFGEFARCAGIPADKAANAVSRFFIEKLVLDAVQEEFGFAPDNPLLVFMYDAEENYAQGLAQGWLEASRLISRLRSDPDGIAAFQVGDVEALHRTCTASVKRTDGQWIESAMGKLGVHYALSRRRGLTDAGIREWRQLYEGLNSASDELIRKRALPAPSKKLLTLEEYKRPMEKGGSWVEMRRNPLYSGDIKLNGQSVVRALAGKLVDAFHEDMRKACEPCELKQAVDSAARKEKIRAVIRLCQSLERLHPYPDSNGRVFEFLLPNVLLVASGIGPYAPVEPYRFDGSSREEMLDEIRNGRKEAKKLMPPASRKKEDQTDSDPDSVSDDNVAFLTSLAESLLLFMW